MGRYLGEEGTGFGTGVGEGQEWEVWNETQVPAWVTSRVRVSEMAWRSPEVSHRALKGLDGKCWRWVGKQ